MEEVKNYFSKKAKEYDLVENQLYWKLSDQLLWHFFKKEILTKLPEDFIFLDAGGGTGRWTYKILKEFPNSHGAIYDFSEEMLYEAKSKLIEFRDRIKIIKGNLENMDRLDSNQFDLVFNFHNVLGFVNDSNKAFSEMVRVLNEKGFLVSFIPNLYHLIYFNIKNKNVSLAEKAVQTMRSKFVDNMPDIELFTPKKMEALYLKNGLRKFKSLGFPITIYPGYNETQIKGSSKELLDVLSDEESFSKIYFIEKKLISKETTSRGNNLFVWGRK